MFLKLLLFSFRAVRFLWHFFSGFIYFLVILSFFVSLLAIGLVFSFNLWFPSVAKWYVVHKSEFRFKIEESKCALYRGLIDFNGIEVRNPEGKFSQDDCLKISRIMVKANLLTVFNPEMVIEEVILEVDRIVCDANKQSEINILSFMEAFASSEGKDSKLVQKSPKNDRSDRERKKYPVKVAADKLNNGVPLRFFSIHESGQCVAKKMLVYLGKFELYNVIREGESTEIAVNATWNFTDVRSQSEVIEAIKARLQRHGINLIIQNAFEAIFNLPGIKHAKRLIVGISRFSQDFFKGITESVMKMLPSKEDMNLEDNLARMINPASSHQLLVQKNVDDSEENAIDVVK
ncbi:MAG: hypothetical protein LBD60_02410 [Puniceicoccales bacterium]|jgi:hypothetical protein|nr:hypothetical protein [Puniceicoccales bacterium]